MLTVPSSARTVRTASRLSGEALSASISRAMLLGRSPGVVMSAPPPGELCVQAPRTGARGREIEEDEAEEDRRVAHVEGGEGALPGMIHPVGDRHLTRQDEGDRPGEQADQDQGAADQLEH